MPRKGVLPKAPTGKITIEMMEGERKKIVLQLTDELKTVRQLEEHIQSLEGIPVQKQRLFFEEERLNSPSSLGSYDIMDGSAIELYLEKCGGGCGPNIQEEEFAKKEEGAQKVKEMTIAPGGFIKQTIVRDSLDPEDWDIENSFMFNLQLIDASTFPLLGLPVPDTPITAKTYATYKYPFYEMYEEKSIIAGDFDVKSVGDLDKASGKNVELHAKEQGLKFESKAILSWKDRYLKQPIVKINTVDEMSQFLPIRLREMFGHP